MRTVTLKLSEHLDCRLTALAYVAIERPLSSR